jgi:hypothetical protein
MGYPYPKDHPEAYAFGVCLRLSVRVGARPVKSFPGAFLVLALPSENPD